MTNKEIRIEELVPAFSGCSGEHDDAWVYRQIGINGMYMIKANKVAKGRA